MQTTKNRAAGDQPGHAPLHTNDGRPEPSWNTSATAENAALASVALEEERNPERLIEAAYALSVSPMFVVLCADFDQQPKSRNPEQRYFDVRLFAARMFLAGLRTDRVASDEWLVTSEGGGA